MDASAATVFAWLGNLRVAPYSYDLLDNRGRRSPRRLRADLPPLAVGQRAVAIFDVLEVVEGEELTLATRGDAAERVFGPVTLTYAVRPGRCAALAAHASSPSSARDTGTGGSSGPGASPSHGATCS